MGQTNENITLSEWTNELLSRRELQEPDGRHLYQYRITDAEFNELETILKRYISVGQYHLGFSNLAKRTNFPILFVLYGAEWWRRRYDGSGFSWDGILSDLGANLDEWNPSQRSECVRVGLRAWDLRILQDSGFRFLGSIAIQGGLPMKPLAEARGGIGQLLGRVLRAANNRLVDPIDIQGWVESLQHWLPKSYRQQAIFVLLAEVAWTVLMLKQKAGLDSNIDAISRLDSKIPDWRNKFPLPIEDDQARQLIEQLVREAATIRLQKPSVCLPVERFLKSVSDGEWEIFSDIDLPDTIEAQKLAKLFEVETDELPRFADLSIIAGDKARTAAIRKMAGNNSFRIEGATWDFSGATALDEHLLKLNSTDGRTWTAPAMKGQQLEHDLPWIFSVENFTYSFIRQGAGGVTGNEVIIVLPPNWKISENLTNGAVKIGFLKDSLGSIYRVTETIFVENEIGSRCKISIRNAEAATENFDWRGRRWWLDFISPSVAFKGKPNLFRVDEDGNAFKINSAINCTAIGAPDSNHWLGPVTLSYSANGELKHKSRMTLLPQDASLSLDFGDALSGEIVFDKWQVSEATVITPNVNFTRHIEGDSLILKVSVSPEFRAPDQVTVELFWRHTSTSVRLAVPFPSKGIRAFDSRGNELNDGSLLAHNQLFGVRLSVLSGGISKKIQLTLQTNKGGLSRNHYLQTLPGAISLEVRLSDYLMDIDHLLSLNDSPDSKVKISLSIGNEESFSLNIARYATVIERSEENVLIATEDFEQSGSKINELPVFAIRLEDPNEEPTILQINDEVFEGKSQWIFSPNDRKPGAWLIYPGAAAEIDFRPTLWTIPGELTDDGELARAINFSDQSDRNKALDQLIVKMAEDFAHSGWEEITRLAELIGHLPLTTLDIWRRFARSASGMAALAFRYGKFPEGFISRFENELPFSWEVIPFSVWKAAISRSFEYCRELFGEEIGKSIFDAHAQRRIHILTARHGGLSFLLGIASMEFFPETQKDCQILRTLEDYARQQLFSGEHSHLQNLLRIHADDEWVADSDNLLEKKWENPHLNRYFYTDNLIFQNPVINTPLLLAAEAVMGGSASWLKNPAKIHLLRTFRFFDPEWFDEAYNWTVARCLADGLLDD